MFATQIFFSLVDFLLLCFWVCFFKGSVRSPGGGHGSRLQVFLPGECHGGRSLAGYSP